MAYSEYNKRRFQGPKPVNEGDEYDIEIEGIGTKGDGIGRINGFVVITPNAKVGDKVKVKITAVRGKVAFAEIVGQAEAKAEEKSEGAEEEAAEETEAHPEESEAVAEQAEEEPVEEEAPVEEELAEEEAEEEPAAEPEEETETEVPEEEKKKK